MRGAEQLGVVVARLGPALVAERIGVTEGSVRHAVAGRATPRPKVRAKLAKEYGIPVEAWAGGSLRAQQTTSKKGKRSPVGVLPKQCQTEGGPGKNPVTSGELPAPSSPQSGPAPAPDDVRANLAKSVEALQKALEKAEGRMVPPIAQAMTRTCTLLARLSGQLEITESQIVRSLPWRKAMGLLEQALAPFPDAARAIRQAFEDFGQ